MWSFEEPPLQRNFLKQILVEFYIICGYIFITKIHNVTVQMKIPNSRNSTAFSAVVCEKFCPRGPASFTPSPL